MESHNHEDMYSDYYSLSFWSSVEFDPQFLATYLLSWEEYVCLRRGSFAVEVADIELESIK
jgi:hypothetical protein